MGLRTLPITSGLDPRDDRWLQWQRGVCVCGHRSVQHRVVDRLPWEPGVLTECRGVPIGARSLYAFRLENECQCRCLRPVIVTMDARAFRMSRKGAEPEHPFDRALRLTLDRGIEVVWLTEAGEAQCDNPECRSTDDVKMIYTNETETKSVLICAKCRDDFATAVDRRIRESHERETADAGTSTGEDRSSVPGD